MFTSTLDANVRFQIGRSERDLPDVGPPGSRMVESLAHDVGCLAHDKDMPTACSRSAWRFESQPLLSPRFVIFHAATKRIEGVPSYQPTLEDGW
jgi:hypothetical protein